MLKEVSASTYVFPVVDLRGCRVTMMPHRFVLHDEWKDLGCALSSAVDVCKCSLFFIFLHCKCSTLHRAQRLTLDKVEAGTSRVCAQVHVAWSRTRCAADMCLIGVLDLR